MVGLLLNEEHLTPATPMKSSKVYFPGLFHTYFINFLSSSDEYCQVVNTGRNNRDLLKENNEEEL